MFLLESERCENMPGYQCASKFQLLFFQIRYEMDRNSLVSEFYPDIFTYTRRNSEVVSCLQLSIFKAK